MTQLKLITASGHGPLELLWRVPFSSGNVPDATSDEPPVRGCIESLDWTFGTYRANSVWSSIDNLAPPGDHYQ